MGVTVVPTVVAEVKASDSVIRALHSYAGHLNGCGHPILPEISSTCSLFGNRHCANYEGISPSVKIREGNSIMAPVFVYLT